ncbi:hypothetical protein BGZ47_001697 [Haplosporangium gracile]|nr:hypothetical protein BGZ47_001697 [Haplosporangium gracile]
MKTTSKLGKNADKKREVQRLIGVFVETLRIRMDSAEEILRIKLLAEKQTMTEEQRIKARRDAISDTKRQILDHLSERIKLKDENEDDDENEDEDEDAADIKRQSNSDLAEKVSNQEGFLLTFFIVLYFSNYSRERDLKGFAQRDFLHKAKDKKKTSAGVVVNHLIDWLVAGHFYKPLRGRDEIWVKMPYTPTYLGRSVAGQLAVEFKKMYHNGICELHKKEQVSAVKNFLSLNKHTNNNRRIVPITTLQQPFVSFSERELRAFFWKRGAGLYFQRFICDVGSEGLTSRKKKASRRAAVRMWTLDDIRSHLHEVLLEDGKKVKNNAKDDKEDDFHPAMYKKKGYVLRGSILTNGFRIKLQAFKLRSLKDVGYRRWREDRLPPRLTSTVGSADYYLQEIRHVLTCKEDT